MCKRFSSLKLLIYHHRRLLFLIPFFLFLLLLLISAPSLGVYYCQQLTLSVCPSVCPSITKKLQIASSFLFLDGIEPFFGRQFSMTPSTKRCSSIFDLDP